MWVVLAHYIDVLYHRSIVWYMKYFTFDNTGHYLRVNMAMHYTVLITELFSIDLTL